VAKPVCHDVRRLNRPLCARRALTWPAGHAWWPGRGQHVRYCGWSKCVHGNRKTKAISCVMEDLSEEHQALYTWIDEIPLSRQKKHVARDFSDGGTWYYRPRWDAQSYCFRTSCLQKHRLLTSRNGIGNASRYVKLILLYSMAEVPNLVSFMDYLLQRQSDKLSTHVNWHIL